MNIAAGLGVQQPPHRREYCACKDKEGRPLFIDALDHPDLIPLAIQAHQQTPEHQRWRAAAAEAAPRFEVRVVQR